MTFKEQRELFERDKKIYESVKLTFKGADSYDVYNSSIPFFWKSKEYLFGRIERRTEWTRSWVRLFTKTGHDEWTLIPNSMIYQLEDPFISYIGDTLVLGGTHVKYDSGCLSTYYGYFYKGKDLHDLYYFSTGPEFMKDIRLVELKDGAIGVFSRPRSKEILDKYGSESQIGFTIIRDLNDLSSETIKTAPYIKGVFFKNEWGGCNQAYLLADGTIGIIGHGGYKDLDEEGKELQVYVNLALVFDYKKFKLIEQKIIGTRLCYPEGPAKKDVLEDCVFSSGIVMRPDGKADLYSGIGDTQSGRIVIDDPFAEHGGVVK